MNMTDTEILKKLGINKLSNQADSFMECLSEDGYEIQAFNEWMVDAGFALRAIACISMDDYCECTWEVDCG